MKKTPEELAGMVINLDPDCLTLDMTCSLLNIFPTDDDMKLIRSADQSKLDIGCRLFQELNKIDRCKIRLECHEIIFSFQNIYSTVNSRFNIIQNACEELNKIKNEMESIFSIVLAIGNYLNCDNKWGQAYGFQIESLNKLSTLKASPISLGTAVNIVATLIEQKSPNCIKISDQTMAISAASEVSYRQLTSDLNILEQQMAKVENEYQLSKGRNDRGMRLLCQRLEQFLGTAKPKLTNIKMQSKSVEANLAQIMKFYGDNLVKLCEEDASQCFFKTLSSFFRSLRLAADENAKKKKDEEKELSKNKVTVKFLDEKEARKSFKPRPKLSRMATKENIFDNFHNDHDAKTDAIVAEFMMKQHRLLIFMQKELIYVMCT